MSRKTRQTTSSAWPRPYTADVSIQLTPSSSARLIVASDTSSSCAPQPNAQFGPPMDQVPNPKRVMFIPVLPSGPVGNDEDALLVIFQSFNYAM